VYSKQFNSYSVLAYLFTAMFCAIMDENLTRWNYCRERRKFLREKMVNIGWCTFTEVIAKLKLGYNIFGPPCTLTYSCTGWMYEFVNLHVWMCTG